MKGCEQGQDFKEKELVSLVEGSTTLMYKAETVMVMISTLLQIAGPFTFNTSHNQSGRHFTDGDNIYHKQKLRKMSLNPSDKATSQTQTFDLLNVSDLLGDRNPRL